MALTCRKARRLLRRFRRGNRSVYVTKRVNRASAHVDTCGCEFCRQASTEVERSPQPAPEVLLFPAHRAPTVSTAH